MNYIKMLEELETESNIEYKVAIKHIEYLPSVLYGNEVCRGIGGLVIDKKAYTFAVTNFRIIILSKNAIGIFKMQEFQMEGIRNVLKSETSMKFDYYDEPVLLGELTPLAMSKLENGIKVYFKERDAGSLDAKLQEKIANYVETILDEFLNEKVDVLDKYLDTKKTEIHKMVKEKLLSELGSMKNHIDSSDEIVNDLVEDHFEEANSSVMEDSEVDNEESLAENNSEETTDENNNLVEGLEYREEFGDDDFDKNLKPEFVQEPSTEDNKEEVKPLESVDNKEEAQPLESVDNKEEAQPLESVDNKEEAQPLESVDNKEEAKPKRKNNTSRKRNATRKPNTSK